MICTICNSDFTSNYLHKKTCSKVCSLKLQRIYRSRWVSNNRESFNSYKRDYYWTKDKEKVKVRTQAYRKSLQGRKIRRIQQKRRLQRDPLYKAKRALRKRLWLYKKKLGTISMSKSIGCTWDEFKLYIESKFYLHSRTSEQMTWENYGKNGWEMDHIIPLCAAKTLNDLEKLSHYTNLQPLWKEDNNLKSLEDLKLKSENIII